MKTFTVTGDLRVSVSREIQAETEEGAIEQFEQNTTLSWGDHEDETDAECEGWEVITSTTQAEEIGQPTPRLHPFFQEILNPLQP